MHDEIARTVRPPHDGPETFQQIECGLARVSEVVSSADADERDLRSPDDRRALREPVQTSVVRDLQHLDRTEQAELFHPFLRRLLGVPGEHRIEGAATHLQDDARVVGSQLSIGLPWRPEDPHGGSTQRPGITHGQVPDHKSVPDEIGHRPPLLALDGRYTDPSDIEHARKSTGPARMIIVGVGQHEDVGAPEAVPCDRPAQDRSVCPCVHEHRPARVTHEDRIALADVQDDDRCDTRRCRSRTERQRSGHDSGQHPYGHRP